MLTFGITNKRAKQLAKLLLSDCVSKWWEVGDPTSHRLDLYDLLLLIFGSHFVTLH